MGVQRIRQGARGPDPGLLLRHRLIGRSHNGPIWTRCCG
jgi:hypothetical protein